MILRADAKGNPMLERMALKGFDWALFLSMHTSW